MNVGVDEPTDSGLVPADAVDKEGGTVAGGNACPANEADPFDVALMENVPCAAAVPSAVKVTPLLPLLTAEVFTGAATIL
jgi:hypothetical protein